MWKVRFDPKTGEILSKQEVLHKDDEDALFFEEKPRAWYIDLESRTPIESPVVSSKTLLPFQKPASLRPLHPYKRKDKENSQTEMAVVRMVGIGDVIMTIPLLRSLKSRFDDIYLSYWTSDAGARVLFNNPWVDVVRPIKYRHPSSGLPPAPPEVKDVDIVVNLINKVDFGAQTWARPRIDNFFMSASNQLRDILDHPLIPPEEFVMPPFHITELQREFASRFMEDNYLLYHTVVGCFLSTHGDCRVWPIERWTELAYILGELRFIWFSDTDLEIREVPENVVNTAGALNFEEFTAILSHCNAIVCPDTSGMHLAEMMRIPCLVLEGSTNVEFHTKYYYFVSSVAKKWKLSCQPCYDWQLRSDCYKKDGAPWCLTKLSASRVAKKLVELL